MPLLFTSLWNGTTMVAQPYVETFTDTSLENPALRHVQTSSGRMAYKWSVPGAHADVEVLAKVVTVSDRFGIVLRGAGSGGSETGYTLTTNAASRNYLSQYVNASFSGVDPRSGEFVSGRRMWMRFRAQGSTLSYSMWLDGDPEPGAWDYTTTDTSIPAAGWVGLFGFGASGDSRYCLYYSVGVSGAVAPSPYETPGADQYAADFAGASPLSEWTHEWQTTDVSASIETTAADIPPVGWNVRWNNMGPASIAAGELEFALQDSYRMVAAMTAAGSLADTDVVALIAASENTVNRSSIRVRASGEAGSESAYYIELDSGTSINLRRYPSVGMLDTASFTWSANTFYWLRLNIQGSVIQGKVWGENDPEPSAWTVSATDTTHVDAGQVGFGLFSGSFSQYIICKYFAVSPDPAIPAPLPS